MNNLCDYVSMNKKHETNSKYKTEFNSKLNMHIYYIPTHTIKYLEPINDVDTVIKQYLWQHPDAAYEMLHYIKTICMDSHIPYAEIRKIYIELSNKYNIQNKLTETKDRAVGRLKSMSYILKHIKVKPSVYLDIGCFDGNITEEVGKYFELDTIYGIDIIDFPNRNKNITFSLYKDTIPFADNSVDIITCLMVLHHVNDINMFILEIKRILKPNGIIIIREHNVTNKYESSLLDMMHKFYDNVWNDPTEQWSPESICNYYSYVDLTKIFENYGFSIHKSINISSTNNIYKNYYCSFAKQIEL